uniref:Uncharacterized protein n=1 Tax=Heterorhabditis bacteriophora TaxID=37862 RepID=A0A1I7WYJ6_HETBA
MILKRLLCLYFSKFISLLSNY